MEVKFYRRERGDSPAEEFIKNNLQNKDKKKIIRALKRVEEQADGLSNIFKSKYAEKLEEDIFELRPLPWRIFFTIKGGFCWVMHIILKKTNKIPLNVFDKIRAIKNLIHNK